MGIFDDIVGGIEDFVELSSNKGGGTPIKPNGSDKNSAFQKYLKRLKRTLIIIFVGIFLFCLANGAWYTLDEDEYGVVRTFGQISVIENLLVASTRSYRTGFWGHLLGAPSLKKEEKLLKAKAMRILKFMGLESYAQWYAMGLPYGILKKVEIARALMADAKLIIMDEPAAGLNDKETAELTETIRKIRDEFGVTILLVEHDMGLVMSVCDTVCAISFGQMLGMGTTEEIQKNKAVQEAYLGIAEEE